MVPKSVIYLELQFHIIITMYCLVASGPVSSQVHFIAHFSGPVSSQVDMLISGRHVIITMYSLVASQYIVHDSSHPV
jgi:hypothetical protein